MQFLQVVPHMVLAGITLSACAQQPQTGYEARRKSGQDARMPEGTISVFLFATDAEKRIETQRELRHEELKKLINFEHRAEKTRVLVSKTRLAEWIDITLDYREFRCSLDGRELIDLSSRNGEDEFRKLRAIDGRALWKIDRRRGEITFN